MGIITHFYLFSNNLMNPDAIWLSEVYYSGWEVTSGRWGLVLIDRLQLGSTSPVLMSLVSIALFSLSAIIICELFAVQVTQLCCIVAGGMIVCSPFVANTLSYYYCSDAYAISFFLAVFAVYCSYKVHSLWGRFASALLIAISISIYQSNLGVVGAVYLLKMVDECCNNYQPKKVFFAILQMLVECVLGLIIYLVVLKAWLKICNLQMSTYKGANTIGIMSTLQNLRGTLINAYKDFVTFFFGSNVETASNTIIMKVCYATVMVLFIATSCLRTYNNKTNFFELIGLLVLLPIACNVIDLAATDTKMVLRTSSGMVAAFPMLFLIAYKNMNGGGWNIKYRNSLKTIVIFICGVLIWNQMLLCNIDSMLMEMNRTAILSSAEKMFGDLQENRDVQKGIPVAIVGTPRGWTMNSDLEKYANGYARYVMVWETADGMYNGWLRLDQRYIGAKFMNWVDYTTYQTLLQTDEVKQMPSYPFDGYIQNVDGVIVCKAGGSIEWAS